MKPVDYQKNCHSTEDAIGMRAAGALAAKVLDYITPFVVEGVSTYTLDAHCHTFICDHGGIPACLGFHGFPKSICTSVNHVVCHGIPQEKQILKKGDIVNIDVTVRFQGWHGDTSRMYVVPPIPHKTEELLRVTQECLNLGIEQVKPGNFVGDIGHAIATHAHAHGFSVVRDFCGHGIGRSLHSWPEILHTGKPKTGLQLYPGMFFTIEPMINMGKPDVTILADGWTVVTRDRTLSAQYEHTLGVTETGYEIFT